jgi:hypothetical protein
VRGNRRAAGRDRQLPDTLHLFPGEEVFLKIFRKILDLVTFFSQNVSVSGWSEGSNGEAILSQVSDFPVVLFSGAVLRGISLLEKVGKHSWDNLNGNSFKICLHFLDLRPFLAHKRLLKRVIRYLGEWSQNGYWR